jgi:hypothetical protein
MMNFEWFTVYVAQMTRQTLTTMGKRAGVTPYRRGGAWHFRTASGEDRTLEQVFAALQANPQGQQWVRDVYEGRQRAAEAQRLAEVNRRQELQDEISAAFDFLSREFEYSPPFPITVRLNNIVVLGYRNLRAARQVEISGHADSYVAHCEIRRLVDGAPGAYNADSIADWELRMMRRWFGDDESLFERGASLRRIEKTLRSRGADIIRGEAWIDRQEIDRKYDRQFEQKFGPPPSSSGSSQHPLDIARDRAEFLVTQHGFVLDFDSGALSPHEWELWQKLRYRRGDTTVEICQGDIRDHTNWEVRVNGATVSGGAADWDNDWDRALADALAEVTRRIS